MMFLTSEIQNALDHLEQVRDEISWKCKKIPGKTAEQTKYADLDFHLFDATDALITALQIANQIEGE